MKILFIGSRLLDDVIWYTRKLGITSIVTESNKTAQNLDLADKQYIVPRGMDKPTDIAIREDVDAVIPLIGIDTPLPNVGKMKETLEEKHGIPVVAANYNVANLAANKYETKKLLEENNIKTPYFKKIGVNDSVNLLCDELPVVLKTPDGQGGCGVKIASNKDDLLDFIGGHDDVFLEEFVNGFEVSIEVLRWNNETVALTPVYKGDTTIEGTHPLSKIKQAPLSVDGIDNDEHNRFIRSLATKIADLIGVTGTMDIDILYDNKTGSDYVIELNTRPSGTRYMTAATSDIYPLCQLVDMARKSWSKKNVELSLKNYYSAELPVGDFPKDKSVSNIKCFNGENSYIVHGPEHYQRVTIRANSRSKLNDMTYELVPDYAKSNNIQFK